MLFFIPALIVLLGCGMSLMPPAAIVFLSAWTCLSFPLAMLVGRCVLNDD